MPTHFRFNIKDKARKTIPPIKISEMLNKPTNYPLWPFTIFWEKKETKFDTKEDGLANQYKATLLRFRSMYANFLFSISDITQSKPKL